MSLLEQRFAKRLEHPKYIKCTHIQASLIIDVFIVHFTKDFTKRQVLTADYEQLI